MRQLPSPLFLCLNLTPGVDCSNHGDRVGSDEGGDARTRKRRRGRSLRPACISAGRAGSSSTGKYAIRRISPHSDLYLGLYSFLQPANSRSTDVDALGVAFVVTGSRDKTVKLWDALTGQCLWTFVSRPELEAALFLTVRAGGTR